MLLGLAAAEALVAGWAAWYMAEALWGSTSAAASLTPLSPLAFGVAWGAGAVVLFTLAPLVGARAAGGQWIGGDPTRSTRARSSSLALSAWIDSVVVLSLASLAAVPVYVALHALGAIEASRAAPYAMAQAAGIVAAPVPGILLALLRRRAGS